MEEANYRSVYSLIFNQKWEESHETCGNVIVYFKIRNATQISGIVQGGGIVLKFTNHCCFRCGLQTTPRLSWRHQHPFCKQRHYQQS